jgi:hypothetical protein
MTKPRLLITGTVTGSVPRADILDMFRSLVGAAELTFVEYDWPAESGLGREVFDPFGELTTWEEERSADALLERVRPDRVVLLFTSSRNQLALRAAARDRGIETVHTEHGYQLPAVDSSSTWGHAPGMEGVSSGGPGRHAFFARSLIRRRPRVAGALLRYGIAVARAGGATPAVLRAFAELRRPDRYVSYSRECFEFHRDVDHVPPRQVAETPFVGVPQFDDFRVATSAETRREALLIDHAFQNAGLFGWNDAFRREWVDRIAEAVLAGGFERLHVKRHPLDRSGAWEPHAGDDRVRLVERDRLPELSRTASVVLGTWSTMQMPFAAQPHIAVISLEIHPEPDHFPSRRFVEAGVAEPVRSYAELAARLGEAEALGARQRPAKAAFTKRFLERLDGGAGERMAAALLGR